MRAFALTLRRPYRSLDHFDVFDPVGNSLRFSPPIARSSPADLIGERAAILVFCECEMFHEPIWDNSLLSRDC